MGYKWKISQLNQHLAESGIDVALLWGRIYDAITKTFISVETIITNEMRRAIGNKGSCFELFGFDILVD